MKNSDWLLLALDLAYPKAVQPVQLQKILFLLDRKLVPQQKNAAQIYNFTPYDYGPFDSAVYHDADNLSASGEIAIERAPGQTFRQYRITDAGRQHAQAVAAFVNPDVLEYARKLVKWCQGLSFNQLVSAIYREYPDMKAKSVFRG